MKLIYLGIGYPVKGDQNIYTDLMKCFVRHGHTVTVVCSDENGDNLNRMAFSREIENGIDVIRVKTPSNVGNVSMIKKGIATLFEDAFFLSAVKKSIPNEKYDLILCSTPPITLTNTIDYLQKRNNTFVYLMLKDIFPQNAVDLGIIRKNSIIYKYFRTVEKRLYNKCNYIGCMSNANIKYILEHNEQIPKDRVGLCVNSLDDTVVYQCGPEKESILAEFEIPVNRTIFIYGGSLGAPQGIDQLIEFLRRQNNLDDRFYVICGKGKEAWKIQEYIDLTRPTNVRYIPWIEYRKYEKLAGACDIGMVLLNPNFTIPNFPSRLLTLTRNGMPVFCATDSVTDVGKIVAENGFGWSCNSGNVDEMISVADVICNSKSSYEDMGLRARQFYLDNYTTENTYLQIMDTIS